MHKKFETMHSLKKSMHKKFETMHSFSGTI